MVTQACKCLNIKVYLNAEPKDASNVVPDDAQCHVFFTQKLSEGQLSIGGIVLEHRLLTQSVELKNWIVYECLNCQMFTHATRKYDASGFVLLGSDLLKGPEFSSIEASSGYSPVYKIIIPEKAGSHDVEHKKIGVEMTGAVMEHGLQALTEQLEKYLKVEELKMEDRIFNYSCQQKASFRQLEEVAKQDKSLMLSLYMSTVTMEGPLESKGASEVQLLDTSQHLTPPMTPEEAHRNEAMEDDIPPRMIQFPKSAPVAFPSMNVGGRHGNGVKRKNKHPPQRLACSLDTEGVFNMDEMEDEIMQPGYPSEEDINYEEECTESTPGHQTALHQLGTSLPVNVPIRNAAAVHQAQVFEPHEEEMIPEDPRDIAASIQAIAQSVQENSEDVFGALPRRRLSSFHKNLG
ncbi:unnamed protein product [Darwinula stevensoni]|uniref:Uncharacterized protein n=1 Tax=Darwinula stevensoni TaxID=69355 RepID=A0A7R8XI18_9CRUS|nr:unnamed protein product [Darwinula stevensoni]CAG0893415.1 unnamed protein product [Darwinula stevensoni]